MRMKAFRSQPNTHEICIAPSGRAKCRKCKGMVAKGSVRIATTAFVRPGRATMFVRHACCVDGSFARAVLAVYGSAARVKATSGVSEKEASRVRAAIEQEAVMP